MEMNIWESNLSGSSRHGENSRNGARFISERKQVTGTDQIKRGALLSYVNIGVAAITALLFTPWIVRTLGASQYGLYTLALTLVSLFTIDLGLGESTARFLSKYRAEGDVEGERRLATIVLRLYIAMDVMITIGFGILFALLPVVYKGLTPEEMGLFRVAYVIVALYAIATFPFLPLDGVLISRERFVFLRGSDLAQKLLTLILTAIILLSGGALLGLVVANTLAGILVVLVKLAYARNILPARPWPREGNRDVLRDLIGFSFWLGITGVLNRLVMGLAPTLIGIMSTAREIGLFGIGAVLEGYVYTIGGALTGLFLPRITRLLAGSDANTEIVGLMTRVGRFQLSLVGLIYVGLTVFGRGFIDLWVGKQYSPAYWCALILIAPNMILIPQQLGRTAIIATGKVREQMVVYLFSAIASIAISLVAIPSLGAVGAAIGVAGGYSVRIVGMNIVYSRSLELDMVYFFKECYLRIGLVLAALFVLGMGIEWAWPQVSWASLALKVLVLSLSGGISVWFFGFNRAERALIKGLVSFRSRERA